MTLVPPAVLVDSPSRPVPHLPPRDVALPTPGELRAWRIALIVCAGLAVEVPLLEAFGVHSPVRVVLALLSALLVPGVPVARLIGARRADLAVTTVTVTSLAANLLVPLVLLLAGFWHPLAGQLVLSAIALGGVGAALPSVRGDALPAEREDGTAATASTGWVRTRRAGWWSVVIDVSLLIAAVDLLVWGLATIHLDRFSSVGVIGLISPPYVAALVLLAGVIGVELTRRTLRPRMLAAWAVLFVLTLFSLPNLGLAHASQPTGYLHVGFAQYIAEHGAVPRHYDARFAWPGFFAGLAALTNAAGIGTAEPLLRGAPIVFELLLLAPLRVLAGRLLPSPRAAWLAVFLFFTGVWFEQDYLSPQAIGLVFYLAILALALSPAVARGPLRQRWRHLPAAIDGPARSRLGFGLVLLLALVALVPSHQLTPTPVIVALALFALLGATPYRRLWLIAGLLFLLWFAFGARDYWSGHLSEVFGSFGKVGSTLDSGVGSHVHGNRLYSDAQLFRLALSASFVVAALAGAVVLRRSRTWLVLVGLAFLPFGLVGAQDYGGEVVIRTVLYAMPGLAILSAGLLHAVATSPLLRRPQVATPLAVLVIFAGSLALVAARGTNVSFEQVTTGQLDAAAYVGRTLPNRGVVAVYEPFSPLALYSTKRFKVVSVAKDDACDANYTACVPDTAGMVYLSSSEEAYGRLKGGLPAGWLLGTASAQLVATGDWTVSMRAPDAQVLTRVGCPGSRQLRAEIGATPWSC